MEPIEAQAGDSQAKAYQPHAQDRSSEERDTLQEDVEMLQDVEYEEAVERTKIRDWTEVRRALEAIGAAQQQSTPAQSRGL
ncbi:unnamed protein product [Cylicocyclus nassatus]|uniref:Uncharacterized protein n=1 Tax=Cylicocyclus nassatus TaxID=53992 RepID=A0AA36GLB4_CYLNA|nr:unnamed protein product [Cylicocyclus nassatus]